MLSNHIVEFIIEHLIISHGYIETRRLYPKHSIVFLSLHILICSPMIVWVQQYKDTQLQWHRCVCASLYSREIYLIRFILCNFLPIIQYYRWQHEGRTSHWKPCKFGHLICCLIHDTNAPTMAASAQQWEILLDMISCFMRYRRNWIATDILLFICHISYRWLSARLQQLQCVSNEVTSVLH